MLALSQKDEVAIRPVRQGDGDRLIALFNVEAKTQASTLNCVSNMPQSVRRKLEGEDPHTFRLIALHSEIIIGQASLQLKRDVGEQLTIYVRDNFRGHGTAAALLTHLVWESQAHLRLRRIEVDVFDDNLPAIRLYQKFGFETQAQRIDHQGRAIFTMKKTIKEK